MNVAIGNDHAGLNLKLELMEALKQDGYQFIDCGTHTLQSVDYPDIAECVAKRVVAEGIPGILICGTGIGISIAANKIPGIRAALCNDLYTAKLAREHNDANILAIGARVTAGGLALEIARTFLKTPFAGGRHQNRVEKIKALEHKF